MAKKRNKFLVVLLVVVLMLTITACSNQTTAPAPEALVESKYPEKTINVLIGFKPGGGSDQLAQLALPFLEKHLEGATFNKIYKEGAAGAVAWTELAKNTKNDGYTISVTNTPMLMTNYITNDDIKYNITEFTPLANIVTDPGIIMVSKDSPFNTYQDFADAVKAKPGEITVANSGTGGDDFFNTLVWAKKTGLEVQMVPFQGDAPSWQNAAGGKVDVSFNNFGAVYPQVKAGNAKALAVMSTERNPLLPDIPTLIELGVDMTGGSSRGLSAPKGIPEDARKALLDAITKMVNDPDFPAAAAKFSVPVDAIIGDDYVKYMQDNEKIYTEIWNEIKDTLK